MFYVLQYPSFTAFDLVMNTCDRDGTLKNSQIYNWMMFGKLPESINVTPTYAQQFLTADGANRYIQNVEVNPIPAAVSTVSLATSATLTLTAKQMDSATSSNTAYATATVSGETLTITGVAAGTATITVYNKDKDVMFTFTVTVA